MRIVHVISSLNPAAGGPPVVAINLAKAQAALGHEVCIAAEDIPTPIDVPTVLIPQHGLSSTFAKPLDAVSATIASADICHLHGIWEPLLLQFARAAAKQNRPYIITPHGMLDPWSLQQKKWKKQLALSIGYRSMLNRAALVHCLNADEQRLLAPLKLTAPCAIIPNGMFLEELDPPPDPGLFRQHRPGPGTRRYILFLSRLHYKKGLDILIDAFAQIAQQISTVDLVIAGPDDGEAEKLRRRAIELQLAERVWLTGPLYGALKWSALSGASCFCLPSRQEGFSVAILEAMACRVPVVISDQCHFPEVAEVGAGSIVPLQVDAVAAALQRTLHDPSLARKMGQAGQQLVEERFTWNRVAERCLVEYQRLKQARTKT